jgi:hypothetical protein
MMGQNLLWVLLILLVLFVARGLKFFLPVQASTLLGHSEHVIIY